MSKKKKNSDKKTIFVAYQGSRDGTSNDNIDAINYASKEFNNHQGQLEVKTWEEYKKSGKLINIEVLEEIENCEVFLCDVSYFNHNVFFELGYAIAKKKKIFIVLNDSIEGVARKYSNSFLKNVKYTPFKSSREILQGLQNSDYESGLLEKLLSVKGLSFEEGRLDVFYITSKLENQASMELSDFIELLVEEEGLEIATDSVSEVNYETFYFYVKNIFESKSTIIHFLGRDKENGDEENAKNSFFAGLACGLKREVILLAPKTYKAPLDYEDIMIGYENADDCIDNIDSWFERMKKTIFAQKRKIKVEAEQRELNLFKLGVGCIVAEDEKDNLNEYFVETHAFREAQKRNKTLLIGRKGVGKTAVYLKLLGELKKDKQAYLVALKPDSIELLEGVDLSAIFDNLGSRKKFFLTVWKSVVYAKLLSSIVDELQNKKMRTALSNEEEELINFYNKKENVIKLNFMGVVNHYFSNETSNKFMEVLYNDFLAPVTKLLKNYFENDSKYRKIVIIADNLDKVWFAESSLEIPAEMILSLFDLEDSVKKDFEHDKLETSLKTIIFLRKDILGFILEHELEPDKLIGKSFEIKWQESLPLLKTLIEKRFKFVLNITDDKQVDKVWSDFFDIKIQGKLTDPFEFLTKTVAARPRDMLFFVSKLFESAINNSHDKVIESDVKYATGEYIEFLKNNMIAETKSEFPQISNILAEIQSSDGTLTSIMYGDFVDVVKKYGYSDDKIDRLLSLLFQNDYMVGFNSSAKKIINNLESLKLCRDKKRFFLFPIKIKLVVSPALWKIKRN